MKKAFVLVVVSIFFIYCSDKVATADENTDESIIAMKFDAELKAVVKSAESFYHWYFANDFQYISIVKDKKGKCLLDTSTYFAALRTLGTISEKFISTEKQRLQSCSEFLATIDFKDYQVADADVYDKYCEDLYYMYWIGSQENPNSYSINDVNKINDFSAVATVYLNYGGQEEAFATIVLEKDKTNWKITEIKFLSESNAVEENKTTAGMWENSLVTLSVDNEYLTFKYHEQCIYFYPINKISDYEFEMIWAQEMDCKFDNGTGNDFNLKDVPQTGKPFAKFELRDNILHAKYYYIDWIEVFAEKVNNEVFTLEYHRKKEDPEFY